MSNIDEELKDLSKRQYAYEEALIKVIDKKQEEIKKLKEEIKSLYKYTPEKGFRLVGDEDVKDKNN